MMTGFRLSYYRKILFLTLSLGLIPLAILSSIVYVDKINSETLFIENQLTSVSESGSESISDWISERTNVVSAIASDSHIISDTKEILEKSSKEQVLFESKFHLQNALRVYLETYPDIQSFIISDYESGNVIFFTGGDSYGDILQIIDKSILEKDGIEISNPFLYSKTTIRNDEFVQSQVPSFLVSSPIVGESGIVGILSAQLIFDSNMIELPTNNFQSSDSYMIDSSGYYISIPRFYGLSESQYSVDNPTLVNQDVSKSNGELISIINLKDNLFTKFDLVGYENHGGKIVIGAISPIPQTGWSFISEIEKNEAFQGIIFIQVLLSSIIAIVLTIIIGTSFHFASSLANPIKKLQRYAEEAEKGNFEIIPTTSTKDEMGDLTKSFKGMLETLKDTSDIQSQLAIQNNLRRALDESTIVSIFDTNAKIIHVNDNFCRVSKYSRDELIGQNHSMLRSGEHPKGFYSNLWKKISSGKTWHGEICNRAKDGSLFWNDVTIVPFSDKNGKITEYVSIRYDVTEQKELSKKLIDTERLSAIGELSARMSHDIRNPLSIISNDINILKAKKLLDKKQTLRMEGAMQRITHQIDEVLDFVRQTPLSTTTFDLFGLVRRCIEEMKIPDDVKVKLEGQGINFEGDKEKMEIVLINLIFNAVQAVDGNGNVEIRLSETDSEVKIEVEDSGSGISIKPIEKIFDPLVTSKQKGTGLGLASVKNIVEQHMGTVSVTNNPTVFTVRIPRKEISH